MENKLSKAIFILLPIFNFPLSFARSFLNQELAPNRIPAFGIDPIKVTPSPLYKERNPVVRVVYKSPLTMPLKGGFWPAGNFDFKNQIYGNYEKSKN